MTALRTNFYLDRRNAKWKGVCAGLANYLGVDPLWVRVAAVSLTFVSGPWTLLVYWIAAKMASEEPYDRGTNVPNENTAFWQNVRTNASGSARQLNSEFNDMSRRLADIEEHYLRSNRRLADEIDALR